MPSSGLGEQSQQVYGSRRRDGGDGANNARRSAADMQRVEAGHRSATGGFVGPRRTPGERTWVAPSRRDGQTQVENQYYVGAPSQARREETRPASTVPNRITPGSLSRKPATPRIEEQGLKKAFFRIPRSPKKFFLGCLTGFFGGSRLQGLVGFQRRLRSQPTGSKKFD